MKAFCNSIFFILSFSVAWSTAAEAPAFLPGERTLFEAHNCYPYHGLWNNRIDKALEAGVPTAIEIDVMWHVSEETQEGQLVVAHNEPLTGKEPTLEHYFFDRTRAIVEEALTSGDKSDWPLLTLNINDIRSRNIQAYEAVKKLTDTYATWLCGAIKGEDQTVVAPIDVKPILVLTNGNHHAVKCFYEDVPQGEAIRVFGKGNPNTKADNFHRWINYSWRAVEPEGQLAAKEWNQDKKAQLQELVDNAHKRGYWIRFYSLNGHPMTAALRLGLSPGYNFGSLEAAKIRWEAAVNAGVDFIATDQIATAKASRIKR